MDPERVGTLKTEGRTIAAIAKEHYDHLREVGFEDDEAFELAANYHWWLLTGEEE